MSQRDGADRLPGGRVAGRQPTGEALPHLIDLVDRGLIRILDLAFIAKDEDGSVAALEIADLGDEVAEFAAFEGASSGLLGDDDIAEAGNALEPGTSAALLVFENSWAAPFAAAVRRSGGQLVASGRIPVQDVLAALDAVEAAEEEKENTCQDYFEEWRERRSSPAPPPRSATASPAARASAGPSRKNSSSTAGPRRPWPRAAAPPAASRRSISSSSSAS